MIKTNINHISNNFSLYYAKYMCIM
uniref:Uncharacterized protein n=1 Tax=Anguilla anguilla TaxID=7936 RepID=A0A0E9SQI2_ANGAN